MKQLVKQYYGLVKQWPITVFTSVITLLLSIHLNHTTQFYDDITYLIGHLVGSILLGFLVDELISRTTDQSKKASIYLAYGMSQVMIYVLYNYAVNQLGWPGTRGIIGSLQVALILVYSLFIVRRVGKRIGGSDEQGLLNLLDNFLTTLGYYLITLIGVYLTMLAIQYVVYDFSYKYYFDVALILLWAYSQYYLMRVSQFTLIKKPYLRFLIEWIGVPLMTVYTIVLYYGVLTGQQQDFYTGYGVWAIYLVGSVIIYWLLGALLSESDDVQHFTKVYKKSAPYLVIILALTKLITLVKELFIQDFKQFNGATYYLAIFLVGVIIVYVHQIINRRSKLPKLLTIPQPYLLVGLVILTQLPYIGGYSLVTNNSERIIQQILAQEPSYLNDEGEFVQTLVESHHRDELVLLNKHVSAYQYYTGDYPQYNKIKFKTLTNLNIPYEFSEEQTTLSASGYQLFDEGIDLTPYKRMTYLSGYGDEVDYLGDQKFSLGFKRDEVDVSQLFVMGNYLELTLEMATVTTKKGNTYIVDSVYIDEMGGRSSISGYYLE